MTQSSRYSATAIALHWAIALGIIGQILLGWNMEDSENLFQLHKSIGITILFLTVARLVLRLINPVPPLPTGMAPWEKTLSTSVHWIFYILMLALPLTGWLLVSTSHDFDVPTVLFGVVSWPDIPGVGFLSNETGHEVIEFLHSKLAWVAIVLLGLHIAGAAKHELSSEEGVLKRMIPGLFGKPDRPSPPPRGFVLAFGTAIILFVVIAWLPTLFGGSTAAQPADREAATDISANWAVDYEASGIRFSGTHDGSEYEGAFEDWRADIRFDSGQLDEARVFVTVQTGSATAGKKLYTDSLRADEWLGPSAYPEATVDLSNFRRTDEGYVADAAVTIKQRTATVPFAFALDLDEDEARMKGETRLQRSDFDLGQKSDPAGEWVGEDVVIDVDVRASRTG